MGLLDNVVDGRVTVVADIGQNHCGDPNVAEELIYRAHLSGCDAVKSQKRCEFAGHWSSMPYSGKYAFGDTYLTHRKRLEFDWETHDLLSQDAATLGIEYILSPFDREASLGCAERYPFIKIPSAFLTDEDVLAPAALSQKPIVLSTGMSDDADMHAGLDLVRRYNPKAEVYILHCVSGYPCNANTYDIKWLSNLSKNLPPNVHGTGISLHVDPGEEFPELCALVGAAVCVGASIVEFHLTLDRTARGRDHQCSLEPEQAAALVRAIRAAEQFRGDGERNFELCELEPAKRLQRMKGEA